jgi:branched-chain amino acid transport system permease protein
MNDFIQVTSGALSNAAIYSLVALSLVLVYRSSGIINFGVGAIAVFVGIQFANGPGGWGGLGVALLVGVALGAVFYLVSVAIGARLGASHAALAISTLGFGLVIEYLAETLWEKRAFTADPLWAGTVDIGSASITNQRILTVIIAIAACGLIILLLERTTLGSALEAVAHNATAAASYGVHVLPALVVVWMFAGLVAGLAGALLAPLSLISGPQALPISVSGFAAAVVGGFGSVGGAVLGAVAVALAEALFIRFISGEFASGFSFLLIVAVLAARPQGILGQKRQVVRT